MEQMNKREDENILDEIYNSNLNDSQIHYNQKLYIYMKNIMISPSNMRLKFFHLILALSVFVDFIITGLCVSNYYLMMEVYDPDFLNN